MRGKDTCLSAPAMPAPPIRPPAEGWLKKWGEPMAGACDEAATCSAVNLTRIAARNTSRPKSAPAAASCRDKAGRDGTAARPKSAAPASRAAAALPSTKPDMVPKSLPGRRWTQGSAAAESPGKTGRPGLPLQRLRESIQSSQRATLQHLANPCIFHRQGQKYCGRCNLSELEVSELHAHTLPFPVARKAAAAAAMPNHCLL